jgi:hypothetical protein
MISQKMKDDIEQIMMKVLAFEPDSKQVRLDCVAKVKQYLERMKIWKDYRVSCQSNKGIEDELVIKLIMVLTTKKDIKHSITMSLCYVKD